MYLFFSNKYGKKYGLKTRGKIGIAECDFHAGTSHSIVVYSGKCRSAAKHCMSFILLQSTGVTLPCLECFHVAMCPCNDMSCRM